MMKHAARMPVHALAAAASEIPLKITRSPIYYNNFTSFLSSCKDLKSLLQIHGRLIVSGFIQDNFSGAHLINSYSLFYRCDFARFVFDSTPNPDVILWNSMIRGYTRSNQYKEALELYHYMLEKRLEPDKYTFTFVLKACTGALELEEGVLIHRDVVSKGLECDVFIATGLIDMYCKLGDLRIAREVFDNIPKKDVVAWNAMIAGLAQSSDPHNALECFWSMQLEHVVPNAVSLLNLFPAVSELVDIGLCRSVHGYVIKRSFCLAISNGLIDMYCKCGDVDVAQLVFDQMENRDEVSWGTLMAGYAHNGCFHEVLGLFDAMKRQNIKMNKVSAVTALLAAAEMKDLEKGKEIHDCAVQRGIDSDVMVATPIITMYAKCGELEKAKRLFERFEGRDLVAWSAVIAALIQSGSPAEALSLFREMQKENVKPNRITLMSVLPACGDLSSLRIGRSVHCYAVKADIDADISTGTALVSMYAKCGSFATALLIFNKMQYKDAVTWNVFVNGYAQVGDPYHAIKMFQKFQLSGMHPDSGTMVGLVLACTLLNDIDQGRCIYGQIIKSGFESDTRVKNALVDMYVKCGSFSSAKFLFNQTVFTKDEVSWNIMIAGYMQHGHAKEALSAFHQMKSENFRPNQVTFVSILPVAAYLAALREGMAYHASIIQMGFLSNTLVGNCLIDMYAKCGQINYSEKCFIEMENRDTVSWNSMLAGYAVHGQGNHSIALFSLMQESQVQVDSMSFVSVLSACRHAGLVEEGREIFHSMSEKHHLEPNLEHYACMVDLLGRAGLFDEAISIIKTMPMEPDAGVWGALLGACRTHSNVKLGEVALDHLVKLEPGNPAHSVILSNIYAQSGRWGDAGNTRSKMNETRLKKAPGYSWVEVKNGVHPFQVGDHRLRALMSSYALCHSGTN